MNKNKKQYFFKFVCYHCGIKEIDIVNSKYFSAYAEGLSAAYNPILSDIVCPKCGSHVNPLFDVEYDTDNNMHTLVIPEGATSISANDYPIKHFDTIKFPVSLTRIGNDAFKDVSVKKLEIPGSVSHIGDHAFYHCYSLKEVVLKEGIKSIGTGAFQNCGIEEILLPRSLSEISEKAFAECDKLTKVDLPSGLWSIGEMAFLGCKSLEKVKLPEGLMRIGNKAFEGCNKLCSINLPESLQYIGDQCFQDSRRDSTEKFAVIPKNVSSIGSFVFGFDKVFLLVTKDSYGQKYAELNKHLYPYAVIPQAEKGIYSTTGIVDGTLYYYAAQEGASERIVSIPEGITTIARYAFCTWSKNMIQLKLPQSLKYIDDYAFFECERLTRITFQEGIIRIGNNAFFAKDGWLRSVRFPSSIKEIGDSAFCGHEIEQLTFDNGLEVIGRNAFKNFLGKQITLPSSIKLVAENAFGENTLVYVEDLPIEVWRVKNNQHSEENAIQKQIDEALTEVYSLTQQIEVERQLIKALEQKVTSIKSTMELKQAYVDQQRNSLASQIHAIQDEIATLNEELMRVSFLSVFKKKAIQSLIKQKEGELSSKQRQLKRISGEFPSWEKPSRNTKDTGYGKLYSVMEECEQLRIAVSDTVKDIDAKKLRNIELEGIIRTDTQNKIEAERKLASIKATYEQKIDKAKSISAYKGLCIEKNALLTQIGKPKEYAPIVVPQHNTLRSAPIDEEILNDALVRYLLQTNAENKIRILKEYYRINHKAIKRIKQINLQLGLDENDSLPSLSIIDDNAQDENTTFHLDRFVYLCNYFGSLDEWNALRKCSAVPRKKRSFLQSYTPLFSDTTYFMLDNPTGPQLVFFPYCLLHIDQHSGIEVAFYQYDTVRISYSDVEYEDKDNKGIEALSYQLEGEIISQRYSHQNADGTPSRRYKYNPPIYTIRKTWLVINYLKYNVKVMLRTQDEAEEFKALYNAFYNSLNCEDNTAIYLAVKDSADIEMIKPLIDKAIFEKTERKRQEKQRSIELAKKEKQEKKAALQEKEVRKQAIIQHQLELNEQRKKERKVDSLTTSIANDEPSQNYSVTRRVAAPSATIQHQVGPFVINGDLMISNNIFKLTLTQLESVKDKSLSLHFVSTKGEEISNMRTVEQQSIGDSIVISFTLKPGIDYTLMKACTLEIKTDNEVYASIPFLMSISFISDF